MSRLYQPSPRPARAAVLDTPERQDFIIERRPRRFCRTANGRRSFASATRKVTKYCYTEQQRQAAIKTLGAGHEITRFKGLGEISASEFKDFIGENIRLDPVNLHHLHSSDEILSFFMGKNTPERQDFIIENLRVEKDLVEQAVA
jgi:hypothetical protein